MKDRLKGKVAIVTGASKGIGASIATHLAEEGASVVVNYSSSKEGADKVVQEIIAKGGRAIALHSNLSHPDEIKRLFEETKLEYGKLDILVNNAGIYDFKALGEITVEHFHKIFDLNVLGLLLASQEAVKHFSEGGCIINISSIASTVRAPNVAVYSASKAAVDAITRVLAVELGPWRIRINSVNPGLVITEGVKRVGFDEGDYRTKAEADTPLGRIGLPDDIAPIVAFLASDEASWITGEHFHVSGGRR